MDALSWTSFIVVMVLTTLLSLNSIAMAKPSSTTLPWDVSDGNETYIETMVVRAYQFGPPGPPPPFGPPGGPGMPPGVPPGPYGPGGGPYGGQNPCRMDPLACTRDPYLNRYYNNSQSLRISTVTSLLSVLLAIRMILS